MTPRQFGREINGWMTAQGLARDRIHPTTPYPWLRDGRRPRPAAAQAAAAVLSARLGVTITASQLWPDPQTVGRAGLISDDEELREERAASLTSGTPPREPGGIADGQRALPELTTVAAEGGLVISLEGLPGAGKSTQCRLLVGRLTESGLRVAHVPDLATLSTDDLGGRLDAMFASSGDPFRRHDNVLTDSFLAAAIRANIIATTIEPARVAHDVVIEDRGVHTMYAYSLATAMRDYPHLDPLRVGSWLRALGELAGPPADVALWLRPPVATALRRATRRSGTAYSGEQMSYLNYVDRGYEQLAATDRSVVPIEIHDLDPHQVHEEVYREVCRRLP
jgi:dTMP kinase